MGNDLEIEWGSEVYAYPVPPLSTNPDPAGRREENLAFGAIPAYNDFYRCPAGILNQKPGIPSAQAAVHALAKYYGVHRNEISEGWVKHYASWYMAHPLPHLQAKERTNV